MKGRWTSASKVLRANFSQPMGFDGSFVFTPSADQRIALPYLTDVHKWPNQSKLNGRSYMTTVGSAAE